MTQKASPDLTTLIEQAREVTADQPTLREGLAQLLAPTPLQGPD